MARSVGLAVHASNGDECIKGPMKNLVKRSSTYSLGLAVHANNGDVCLKGPMKNLVKRSSTYRKFSVSSMSLGR